MTANDPPTHSPAAWHRRSGLPDDVTDDGLTVPANPGLRLQAEKLALRSAARRISHSHAPEEARTLARLAASYLLAGDVETAARYLTQAEHIVDQQRGGA